MIYQWWEPSHIWPLKTDKSLRAACVHTSSCHAIATQQHKAMMSRSWSVCQSSNHVNVRHVEWRQQQVTGKSDELKQTYLQYKHTSNSRHSQILTYKLEQQRCKITTPVTQCIGMQPFSNSCNFFTTSCYHKSFSNGSRVNKQTYTPTNRHYWKQEVKVIWQKAPHGGPIPRLGVTPGGSKFVPLNSWGRVSY